MVESKTVAGVISMQETTEQKRKRYKIAKKLFTDLLNPENPGEVQRELEEKIKLCEEKIEQLKKPIQDTTGMLHQVGDKIINVVKQGGKKSFEEHKKIKKGVIQILNTVQPKPEVRAKPNTPEIEYDIWTECGKFPDPATQEKVNNFQKIKPLFVDGNKSLAYNKNKPIIPLQKSPQSYNILMCFLKNRGGATPERIFRKIYPDRKGVSQDKTMKEDIATPIDRLENILENISLGGIEFRGSRYYFEKMFDFVLALKKNKD